MGDCIWGCDNKTIDTPMKQNINNKILIIDIILSWKLVWDQWPKTIRILHEWNTKTTRFQSKIVLVPELLTYSLEDRLPNHLIQTTRLDQTYLQLCNRWSLRMDKLFYPTLLIDLITFPRDKQHKSTKPYYLTTIWALLLTWINCNPSMDK